MMYNIIGDFPDFKFLAWHFCKRPVNVDYEYEKREIKFIQHSRLIKIDFFLLFLVIRI